MAKYRFDELGCFEFESLCQALLKQEFGLGVESWGGTGDRGRDAYSPYPLKDQKGRTFEPPIVFQCKFCTGANAAGAKFRKAIVSAAQGEIAAISDRLEAGEWSLPHNYFFLTNAPMSSTFREEVRNLFLSVMPDAQVIVQGAGDICSLLDAYPTIRSSFPQLWTLRDLDYSIDVALHRAVYERSRLGLAAAIEAQPTFVPTAAYHQALEILRRNYFVVLTGPPEMGKTTIAHMLGLCANAVGFEVFFCRQPSEFLALASELSSKRGHRIFIVDDAFGTTEYDALLAADWAADLHNVLKSVGPKTFLVLTSRTAPMQEALRKMHIQASAAAFPRPAELIVDASTLTATEKVLMVYRHLRESDLSPAMKKSFVQYVRFAIRNDHFTPQRISLLIKNRLPEILQIGGEQKFSMAVLKKISEVLSTPTKAMQQSFDALPLTDKRALIALLDAPGRPRSSQDADNALLRLFPESTSVNASRILPRLTEHFVRVELQYSKASKCEEPHYDWQHPTWGDLVIAYLAEHRLDRKSFLARCSERGVALALSTAGGTSGKLIFPLLVDAEDWQLLERTISRLLDVNATDNLINAFTEILKTAVRTGVRADGVTKLVHAFLESVRRAWKLNGSTNVYVVERVFALADLTNIKLDSVNLSCLCSAALSRLEKHAGRGDATQTSEELNYLADVKKFLLSRSPSDWSDDVLETVESLIPEFYEDITSSVDDADGCEDEYLGGNKYTLECSSSIFDMLSQLGVPFESVDYYRRTDVEEALERINERISRRPKDVNETEENDLLTYVKQPSPQAIESKEIDQETIQRIFRDI